MTKRLKILLSIWVVVMMVSAGGLFMYQKQLRSSADTLSPFSSLSHHHGTPKPRPSSPYIGLNHNHKNFLIVTTNPASSVSTTSATLNGSVNKQAANRGFVLYTGSTCVTGPHYFDSAIGGIGNFSQTLKTTSSFTLQPNTAYSYKAYASAVSGGLSLYGNCVPFTTTSTNPVIATYTITSSATSLSANYTGTITPLGNTTVQLGKSQQYIIKSNAGSNQFDVLVDGKSIGAAQLYTFTNVTTNHTIVVNFGPIPVVPTPTPKPTPTVPKPTPTPTPTPTIIPQAMASGIVTYSSAASSGAIVTIAKTGIVTILKTLTTDTKGIYQVTGLAAGNYSATAKQHICTKYFFFINICRDYTGTANFTLTAGKNTVIPNIVLK